MLRWIDVALVFFLTANLAMAERLDCEAPLREKNVPGVTRNQILKSCKKVHVIEHCEKLADDRQLLGNGRINFIQNCASVQPVGNRRVTQ